jgi:hypothetical protein
MGVIRRMASNLLKPFMTHERNSYVFFYDTKVVYKIPLNQEKYILDKILGMKVKNNSIEVEISLKPSKISLTPPELR